MQRGQKDDEFEENIDCIIKKVRDKVVTPTEVLSYLLNKHLLKCGNRPFYCSKIYKEPPDVAQTKILLDFLKKNKNEYGMILLIQHLNHPQFAMDAKNGLAKLLGAFFSIYKQYQANLAATLLENKIICSNIWDDYISRWIDKICWDMRGDASRPARLAACEALSLLSGEIPLQARLAIADALIQNLNHHNLDFRKGACKAIVKLKYSLTAKTERVRIVECLLQCIEDEEMSVIACNTLVQLKAWTVMDLTHIIQEKCLNKMNDELFNFRKQGCILTERLGEATPAAMCDSVVDTLLDKMEDQHSLIVVASINALIQVEKIISEQKMYLVVMKIKAKLNDTDRSISMAACEAVACFKNCFPSTGIHRAISIVIHTLNNFTTEDRDLSDRVAWIKIIGLFDSMIPVEKRKAVFQQIHATFNDPNMDIDQKATVMEALYRLRNTIPIDQRPIFSAMLLTILQDTKIPKKTQSLACDVLVQLYQQVSEMERADIFNHLMTRWQTEETFIYGIAFKALIQLDQSLLKRERLDNLLKKISYDDNDIISCKAIKLLGELRNSIPESMRMKIIDEFLAQLEKNESVNVKQGIFGALISYIDDLDYDQKINLLSRLVRSASQEQVGHHKAKVLFISVYNAYKNDLTRDMLLNIPSETNRYLPNEMVEHVMRFIP